MAGAFQGATLVDGCWHDDPRPRRREACPCCHLKIRAAVVLHGNVVRPA